MEASAPPLLVSTKRSTGWPSGVFPNGFFVVELCCGVAPLGARVVISNAPVRIVTAIDGFIRVPHPHIFSFAARISPLILLGDALFRSQNYSPARPR